MTDSGRDENPIGVDRAETALRSLGVRNPAFDRREVEADSWFADWSGEISGSEVYIGLMGGSPTASSVRMLLDDWEFEDVTSEDVGELLRGVFTGAATIRKRRSFPISSVRVLECAVGSAVYSAAIRSDEDERPAHWERRLIAK